MRSAGLLALTGGGIMARFTTSVLEELQAQRHVVTGPSGPHAPLKEAFDLMAGTSAGALCVAGLAVGRSPEELSTLFDDHGPRIFPPGRGLLHWVMSAKYSPAPLHTAVEAALDGEGPRLGEIDCNVAFPAIDENEGRPVVFTNTNPAHENILLKDAVLASAAAPTYFPAHRIKSLGKRFVDGGVFANAPDFAAITIARRLWPQLKIDDIHLLSIGTTNPPSTSPYKDDEVGAGGLYAWAAKPPARILTLAMRGQVDHAMDLLDELELADFIRIDAILDPAKGPKLELDNASSEALEVLREAGVAAVEDLSSDVTARLVMFLARNRFNAG